MIGRRDFLAAGLSAAAGGLHIDRRWRGGYCTARVTNRGRTAVRVKEIVLFDLPLKLHPETALYGESFQMLSQTAGTVSKPVDLGMSELKHYRIPQPEGVQAFSGLMTLTPPGEPAQIYAFTTCRRFIGRFYFTPTRLQVVVDTENLELKAGETWELEEYFQGSGRRVELLDRVARRIEHNHPPRRFPAIPAGWCSWYCFGPRVTSQQVLDNLDAITKQIPGLKYVQIDDGYQPAMGDWLETGQAFGGDVQAVLRAIRERGYQPALWVAPFIAEADSRVFRQHPDWFIRDEKGQPLASNRVTFGGWRRGPWYALDGTHPEAQRHLETVFRTLRREWGCTYFKLDANFWGAMHGGAFHDPSATRIEAYRRGMEAVLRGAGDAFILGCNHPLWPSFGLIHGSRSSNDIRRDWKTIASVARQTLFRNWQNGRLWWNDADAVVLHGGNVPDHEFQFHATAVYASGGMILSGDDLSKMPPDRMAMLRKLLPPAGVAAEFDDETLSVGYVRLPGRTMICLFNWGDAPRTLTCRLGRRTRVVDYWSGQDLGEHAGAYTVESLPGRSARLLETRA